MASSFKNIAEILLPRRCVLCKADISTDSLCLGCLSLCHRVPLVQAGTKDIEALFFYEFSIRELIKGAKFNRRLAYALVLERMIKTVVAETLISQSLRDFAPTAIAYVPTHWLRLSLRALDLPSLFAALLAKELRCPLVHDLKKLKFANQQSAISSKKDRAISAKGQFSLRKGAQESERILLVDDIVTTGATLNEAKKVLSALSKKVLCLAIAKTP